MAAQAEEKKKDDINPKVKAFIDCLYVSEIKFKSSEELAKYTTNLFDDNIDWISTSYHLETSELLQNKGKEACFNFFYNDMFKPNKYIGYTNNIKKMDTNGLSGSVLVEVQLINDENKKSDIMTMEEMFELNENGKCIRFISMTQDYDIVTLTKKQHLIKEIKENENDGKVIIICLDEDFNKIKYELDKKKDVQKVNQITELIKEGESNKKDVMLVIVEPKRQNGKSKVIVSHAIIDK